jgi:hypothetical protein
MKTYARIVNGNVVELIAIDDELDISEMFHPSLTWVPAPGDVAVGDQYDEGVFTRLPPPKPASAVPTSISPAQARLALLGAGLLDQVEAAVAAGSRATQIAWEMATVIERNSPTVAALSAALGLTDAQLDDLFTTAASIFV